MLKEKMKKKGISPVIATVLLIAMVIVIGLIIFLWFKGITDEAVTKFGGKNIELVCNDVAFTAEYSGGILFISNLGNVPIYGMNIKISGQGGHITEDLSVLSSNWPEIGLNQGGVFSSIDLSSEFSSAEEVVVIPILMGTSKKGAQTHTCDEQHGYEVI